MLGTVYQFQRGAVHGIVAFGPPRPLPASHRACRKLLALTARRASRSTLPSVVGGRPMILSAIAERLKRRSRDDFKGRHFEAPLILQAVCWYLRYPLSYRDIEELFLERGL